ncbi:MAG: ShlB/FhaC/HecB family hemolysin secretion/activation protein [Pseudomonadota bacterium]
MATLLVLAIPLAALAAGPDAGLILQQVQPPAPPSLSTSDPGLVIPKGNAARLPAAAPFLVKSVRISGNTLFDTATLHALLAEAEGRSLSLAQLGEHVARITAYYRSHDYPLAQAIVPAQTIRDGVVDVAVIEARYGDVRIDNRSRVKTTRLASIVSLQSGEPIAQNKLDHTLLLLSDTPGVTINAVLTPGEIAGTSDLHVDATPGSPVVGTFLVDGYGNQYTGRGRVGGTLELINPLRQGDVLSVSGLTSGRKLNYGRVGYESLLNGYGTSLGGSYSALRYELGGSLEALDAHGAAETEGVWVKQTLVRSQDVNVYGQVQYNWLQLRDRIDAAEIQTDRHVGNWTTTLYGDARDALLSGGVNAWNLSAASGHVDIDGAAAQLADASTSQTQGQYLKWSAALVRLQRIGPLSTLHVAVSGQWANANLDASDKMLAGGPSSVRAYDIGAVAGDTGYLGTVEFRQDMRPIRGTRWQALAFIDRAQVHFNKSPWISGSNSTVLTGAGLGVRSEGLGKWNAKAYIATPVGATPALVSSSNSARAWVEVGRRF